MYVKMVVMVWKPFYRKNKNIIFRLLNELKSVHLLVIELKHPIFGFKRTNIKYQIK